MTGRATAAIKATRQASVHHFLRPAGFVRAPSLTAAHIIQRRRNGTPSSRMACLDSADAAGRDSDAAEVVVQDSSFGVAAVARDKPHEYTRHGGEISSLIYRYLEVIGLRMVCQSPQSHPVLVIDLPDIDRGARRESERPPAARRCPARVSP